MIFVCTPVVFYSTNPVEKVSMTCSLQFPFHEPPYLFLPLRLLRLKVVSEQQVSKASPVVVDQPAQFKVPVVQEQAQ